jgi:hypothetical protein
MKSLITAFALLGFVAASTVPYVAHAQTTTTQSTTPKKTKKHSAKSHKSVKKTAAKKTKKKTMTPAPTKS